MLAESGRTMKAEKAYPESLRAVNSVSRRLFRWQGRVEHTPFGLESEADRKCIRQRPRQAARTAIFFDLSGGGPALGTRTERMPSLKSAVMASLSVCAGKRKERWKAPYSRSEKK